MFAASSPSCRRVVVSSWRRVVISSCFLFYFRCYAGRADLRHWMQRGAPEPRWGNVPDVNLWQQFWQAAQAKGLNSICFLKFNFNARVIVM